MKWRSFCKTRLRLKETRPWIVVLRRSWLPIETQSSSLYWWVDPSWFCCLHLSTLSRSWFYICSTSKWKQPWFMILNSIEERTSLHPRRSQTMLLLTWSQIDEGLATEWFELKWIVKFYNLKDDEMFPSTLDEKSCIVVSVPCGFSSVCKSEDNKAWSETHNADPWLKWISFHVIHEWGLSQEAIPQTCQSLSSWCLRDSCRSLISVMIKVFRRNSSYSKRHTQDLRQSWRATLLRRKICSICIRMMKGQGSSSMLRKREIRETCMRKTCMRKRTLRGGRKGNSQFMTKASTTNSLRTGISNHSTDTPLISNRQDKTSSPQMMTSSKAPSLLSLISTNRKRQENETVMTKTQMAGTMRSNITRRCLHSLPAHLSEGKWWTITMTRSFCKIGSVFKLLVLSWHAALSSM